jgi:UDP-glucuronate 4-epimerase
MRVLVTGACGFIGFHLVGALLEREHITVAGVDSFDPYYAPDLKRRRLERLKSSGAFTFQPLDLLNYQELSNFVLEFQPQTIYHLAGQAGVRLSDRKAVKYFENNITAFSNILSVSIKHEVQDLLYASSSSVYGKSKSVPYSENDSLIQPSSLYGWSKKANEEMARSLNLRPSIPLRTRGLRFFTVYGEFGRPDMAYFRVLTSLLTGSQFFINGDTNVKRDFTNVNDVVQIAVLLGNELAQRESNFHDVVNIGGGSPISLGSLISVCEATLDRKLNAVVKERFQDDLDITHASLDYLVSLIGDHRFGTIEEMIPNTTSWFQDHVSDLDRWVKSTLD